MEKINISPPSVNYTLSTDMPIFDVQLSEMSGNEVYFSIEEKGRHQAEEINPENKTFRINFTEAIKSYKGFKPGIYKVNFWKTEENNEENNEENPIASAMIQFTTDSYQMNTTQRDIAGTQKDISDSLDGGFDVNVIKSKFPKSALYQLFYNINKGVEELKYDEYEKFIENVLFSTDLCKNLKNGFSNPPKERELCDLIAYPLRESDSYHVLRAATEVFVMLNAGSYKHGEYDEKTLIDHAESKGIYFRDGSFSDKEELYIVKGSAEYYLAALYLIKEKLNASIGSSWIDARIEAIKRSLGEAEEIIRPDNLYVVKHKLRFPMFIELIWSYWHEESMLVQTINAICRRFQNVRSTNGINDPLAEMEITHLIPLNNLLWGYIQDEYRRLTVQRRAYEYDHHYGITLHGKAVPQLQSADSRTKFIGAFHNLLYVVSNYYKESANKMIEPDAFPILNALREVNFIIAEGMHNQYGDLPFTARVEMLMQQWILSRSEFRNFLPGRVAVPYPEAWMERVAAMNRLQGWTDTSPIDFNRLAVYGEKLLLSIRFALWNETNPTVNHREAALWAEEFRSDIQGYVHAYKAATGVDLSAQVVNNKVDARPPSFHLKKQLTAQKKSKSKGLVKQNGHLGNGMKKEVW